MIIDSRNAIYRTINEFYDFRYCFRRLYFDRKKAKEIYKSYIFVKSLSKEQKTELKNKLPKRFMLKDALFHENATTLATAAEMGDSEAVIEEYSNILKSCVSCHAEFATHRFPKHLED